MQRFTLGGAETIVTDFKLYLKRSLRDLSEAIRALQRIVLAKAEESVDWVMPAYTHLQRAQPVTLAHYLLSLFWVLERDQRRLKAWFETHDFCPLGSGACAGSGFPVNRFRLAKELGFRGPTENSIDTVSSRDFAVDAANVCAGVMLTMSRYAEDWILWSSKEFGWLRLDDAYSTGSSMMPQKRNPDSLELIRGKAARVSSAAWRLQTLVKGLPLTYDRDLQEDKEPLFDALDTTVASVHVMTGVLETARFDREKLAAAVDVEMLATDLADYLVLKGVPFR
ncbi:MAG: argininosuccinate lyase, partial [Calditrichaeota bacterium]|nr:argininosuccinate lyase [Calditrichota bacterium]